MSFRVQATPSSPSAPGTPLLQVRQLGIEYPGAGRRSVDGLSFSVGVGEAVALVGESGCGKSSTALAVMGLLPRKAKVTGEILLEGRDLVSLSDRELREVRGNVAAMIFQEPMTSLNPVYSIGYQIVEALRAHRPISYQAARKRTIEMLDRVRLPNPTAKFDAFPHQLSGGQRQRAMIAMAVVCEPRLLVADEPTTALEATIQVQILRLIDELRRELSMGLVLITHDLSIVSRWTDRVVVMHHGESLEQGGAATLREKAQHPYTVGLLGAALTLGDERHYSSERLAEIRTLRNRAGQYRFELIRPELPKASPISDAGRPLLEVKNLETRYGTFKAVDDVSFTVGRGETVGLVGESGSGKSSLSKTILRLTPAASGQIVLDGRDITNLTGGALRAQRRNMQMVFQDPYASLNPRHTVGGMLNDVLVVYGERNPTERRRRVREALDQVGLAAGSAEKLPHEFSGGQRQRISIARALITRPSLVICDEPVSALDVSIQSQILNLLVELKASLGLSYIFISHDLGVIRYMSDRVLVMQNGKIVEEGDYRNIWDKPAHPYTRQLIDAVVAVPKSHVSAG